MELDLIITTTNDGVYVTFTQKAEGSYSGVGFLNKRFDKVEITVQSLDDKRR